MSDLFTRLAQRARQESVALMQAEPMPPPAFGEDEQPEGRVASAAPLADVPPARKAAAPVATVQPLGREPSARAGLTDEGRRTPPAPLVAMPAVVPPPRHENSGHEKADGMLPAPPSPLVREHTTVERTERIGQAEPRAASVLVPSPPTAEASPLLPPLPPPPSEATSSRRDAPRDAEPRSIEVTIGRVEIRVRPPAPVPGTSGAREVALAPALSLEEYLRRRDVSP